MRSVAMSVLLGVCTKTTCHQHTFNKTINTQIYAIAMQSCKHQLPSWQRQRKHETSTALDYGVDEQQTFPPTT